MSEIMYFEDLNEARKEMNDNELERAINVNKIRFKQKNWYLVTFNSFDLCGNEIQNHKILKGYRIKKVTADFIKQMQIAQRVWGTKPITDDKFTIKRISKRDWKIKCAGK